MGMDRDVCKRSYECSRELLEIPLDDFIIIGSGEYLFLPERKWSFYRAQERAIYKESMGGCYL